MKNKNDTGFDAEELEAIKRNIAFQRKKKGLTQIELANLMGVTQRVISYYENEAKTITLDAIVRIAQALKIPKKNIINTDNDITDLPPVSKALQKRISRIKDLSPKSQKTISDMIDTMLKAENV